MKKYIFLKLIILPTLLISSVAGADFYAYQKWVHPKTGQEIHEFFDQHNTIDPKITDQQQKDFIWAVKQPGKRPKMALLEDARSQFVDYEKAQKMDKESKKLPDFEVTISRPSPLKFLHSMCLKQGISSRLCDARQKSELYRPLEDVLRAMIRDYDDGPMLNQFYKNVLAFSDMSRTESHVLEARTLHTIYNHTNKDFFIAMGSYHIAQINNQLMRLGFISQEPVFNKELSQLIRPRNFQQTSRYKALDDFDESITIHRAVARIIAGKCHIWTWITEIVRNTNIGYIEPSMCLKEEYHYPINIREIFSDKQAFEKNAKEEASKKIADQTDQNAATQRAQKPASSIIRSKL